MIACQSVERGVSVSFARRLHELRVANRLSLQDVADQVGMSKAHVWNLEKGLSDNPSIEMVRKLADLFKVGVADLVGENPAAKNEAPEMVAMFRDLKDLDPRDRDLIRNLMEQMKRKPGDDEK